MRDGENRRWKVVVIVEDDTDGRALRSLAGAAELDIDLDWLPSNGIGNIKRKAELLFGLAQDRIEDGQGCIAVIIDRDGKDASRDEPHRTIRRACRRAGVVYLEAVESIEAWLLADDGIRKWLRIKKIHNTDSLPDPRRLVEDAYCQRTRRSYQKRRARVALSSKATGTPARRSPSWQRAVNSLDECQ